MIRLDVAHLELARERGTFVVDKTIGPLRHLSLPRNTELELKLVREEYDQR